MPTCGTERRCRGFTLIELLVVLVLIGLSLGVLLSAGLFERRQDAQTQLELFARALQQISARAVLDGRPQGVELIVQAAAQGQQLQWRWLALQQEQWVEVTDVDGTEPAQTLQADSIVLTLPAQASPAAPGGASTVAAGAFATDAAVAPQPQVLFWPTRESTPLRLELGTRGEATAVLELDLLGRLRVNDDAPPPPLY